MRLTATGWAVTALAAASTAALGPEAPMHAAAVTGESFPTALMAAASLLQLTLSGWVLAVVTLTATTRSSHLARALTPVAVRRALFAGAVGAMTITPAHAERLGDPAEQSSHSVHGLQLPDRPVDRTRTPADPVRPTRADAVVVRPGDTLWAIAARSLPGDASPAVVANAVHHWHVANQHVIGPDPDLIFPGQRLIPPRD